MSNGAGTFNKIASDVYKTLGKNEKERLDILSKQSIDNGPMTVKEIEKAGAKIFNKIQKQVSPC